MKNTQKLTTILLFLIPVLLYGQSIDPSPNPQEVISSSIRPLNENALLQQRTYETWENNQWNYSSRRIFSYDNGARELGWLYQHYINGEWVSTMLNKDQCKEDYT